MSNPFGSPDADAAGNQPTQPFWGAPGPAGANHAGGPAGLGGGPASQPPGFEAHLRKDHGRARRWTVGLLVAVLLAGGGAIAAMSLTGNSGGSQNLTTAADTQQAAQLNSALENAGSPGTLSTAMGAAAMTGQPAPGGSKAGRAARGAGGPLCARAGKAARAAGHQGLPRLSHRLHKGAAHCRRIRRRVFRFFLLRGVQGQFTIQTRDGLKTLAYERGVIQSVNSGKSFVVKSADGTTWTWDIVSSTVVRDRQGKVSQSNLSTGTPVWVGGPVLSGAKDARLVVLRPPTPAPATPSPTPSG